jgi:hypothetical protein
MSSLLPLSRLVYKRKLPIGSMSHNFLTTSTAANKLNELTGLLSQEQLDAYIIPTGDPHLGSQNNSNYCYYCIVHNSLRVYLY